MSGINTIKCENCNSIWPETMEFCQQCHTKLKNNTTVLSRNNDPAARLYSKKTELPKLQKKYNLTNDYMDFLLEEYPNSSIQELEKAIREVLKETNPEQVVDGVLQVTCWNCERTFASELNFCPGCGIVFLAESNYAIQEQSETKARTNLQQSSTPKGIIFAIIIAGFDAVMSVILGIITLPQGFGLYSIILICIGSLELIFVIGISGRSYNSFIGLFIFIIISILLNIVQAFSLLSISGNSAVRSVVTGAYFGLLINTVLDVLVIYALLANITYFDQGNYHMV